MRISYSSLETFGRCPLKFKYQEIDKIKAPKNVEGIFGSVVHSALKFMFERKPLYPTLDQVIDFFREKWESKKDTISPPLEDENNIFINEGINLIKNFYKKNQPWNFNVVGLESPFEIKIKNGEVEHTLSGRIDRIDKNDDTYEIIDYKTARKMPPQKDIDNDLQMSIYGLTLINIWPNLKPENIKVSLAYLKHGEKITTSRTQEQIDNTKNFVLEKIKEIEEKQKTGEFPAMPSGLCDYCGYKKMCPMWRHLYDKEFGKIKDKDELEKIVNEYFELKGNNQKNTRRLTELKMLLFGFMDQEKVERVFGEDGYITKNVSERISYDFEKIHELLEQINKWNLILEPSNKKMEELFPLLPEDAAKKIIPSRIKKHVVSLKISKKKAKM